MNYNKLSITILALALTLLAISQPALADRRYRIYKSNNLGVPLDGLNPDAIIEIDETTGNGFIYDTNEFGFQDLIKGPKYAIQPDTFANLPTPSKRLDDDDDSDDDNNDDDDCLDFGRGRHHHHRRR
jgi:hypothetical protein